MSFTRHGGVRGADAASMKDADILAARTKRFENERNVAVKAAVPKKSMAWAGGSITSNKEAALAKFLRRKAAKGEAVDPALLQKAMEARGERAAVVAAPVDAPKSSDENDRARNNSMPPPSSSLSQKQNNNGAAGLSKAAKKNAKRNANKKRGGGSAGNAQVAAEIHASLFR